MVKGTVGSFCTAQGARFLDTALDLGIVRLAGLREGQVVGGVFVGAIDQGIVGQGGQALQGMVQLGQRSLEIPAAAGAEHHVAAKQHSRGDEGDVVVEVAGYFDDVEFDVQYVQPQPARPRVSRG